VVLESSFTILRVRGIPIGAHWSWLFVFALVVWSLGSVLFPATYLGLNGATYLAMAAAAAVLFFASVLAHELGHALRALAEGERIDGITLWLFGGVARIRGQPASPGGEFRIAAAGPAVTVVLVVAFWLVAAAADALGWHHAVQGLFDYLARINLLGLFTGGGPGGVWSVFLGWFLIQAAQSEAVPAQLRHALGGRRVRDLMTLEPVAVSPDTTVAEFAEHAARNRSLPTYPVSEQGRLVGVVSVGAVAAVPTAERAERRVAEVMTRGQDAPTVAADRAAADVLPHHPSRRRRRRGRRRGAEGDHRRAGGRQPVPGAERQGRPGAGRRHRRPRAGRRPPGAGAAAAVDHHLSVRGGRPSRSLRLGCMV
jgi:Peptidase family M50/CBS domain